MQNLGKDLDHVVGVLLKGSATERKDVMQRCFTEDAEFTHHLLQLHGREEIFALYQYWHDINLKLDFYNTNKSESSGGARSCAAIDSSLCSLGDSMDRSHI